ncbi:unnamed protein product [Linum tenue]|uniref:Uncharacterized protein n=1 Tax=Linum tenue TaxID=586396 RepID=A0AAV0M5C2_9ROSI|nr:unnamed protein product [Linum tenue]
MITIPKERQLRVLTNPNSAAIIIPQTARPFPPRQRHARLQRVLVPQAPRMILVLLERIGEGLVVDSLLQELVVVADDGVVGFVALGAVHGGRAGAVWQAAGGLHE